ncbi:putative quinol monooxygenase [Haloferax sp. DFSO60]|uniref:putative quinol monooxygenase n=1 Tax=Haloferax sp. DFSO60 TaxID=3388652 RepID=UPI00397A65F4
MSNSVYALQARLKAKPEKADEVAEFLESALPMAEDEQGTTTWFALRFDETTFGIFDTFPDEDARQAHLDGDIAAALMENADELLAEEPQIDHVDVLAAKHP